jgi:hypothetical protein
MILQMRRFPLPPRPAANPGIRREPRGFPDRNRTEPGVYEPPELEKAGAEGKQAGDDAAFVERRLVLQHKDFRFARNGAVPADALRRLFGSGRLLPRMESRSGGDLDSEPVLLVRSLRSS